MRQENRDLLIIKIGTNLLMKRGADGSEQLDTASMRRICKQVLELRKSNISVALVLSGAVSAGMAVAGLKKRPDKNQEMIRLQSLASLGWRHVLNAVDRHLDGAEIAEILLTQHELCATQQNKSVSKTSGGQQLRKFTLGRSAEINSVVLVTKELLTNGYIVAVNENDVAANDELKLGDNDTLSAAYAAQLRRAGLFDSVRLVILTDVDGLYEDFSDHQTLVRSIKQMDVESYVVAARGSVNGSGTGGMITKIEAACLAMKYGVNDVYLANGHKDGAIHQALDQKTGTHFHI